MDLSQAGAEVATAPLCATHQEASSSVCERCGVFTCLLCPASASRCDRCEEQELTRTSAMRLVGGPSALLMVLSGLSFLVSVVNVGIDLMEPRGPDWEMSHLIPMLGCGVSALVFVGGIQMRRLRNYPLAVVASIVALLVLFPLGGLGLIVGGAALWALSRASVRAGFHLQDRR